MAQINLDKNCSFQYCFPFRLSECAHPVSEEDRKQLFSKFVRDSAASNFKWEMRNVVSPIHIRDTRGMILSGQLRCNIKSPLEGSDIMIHHQKFVNDHDIGIRFFDYGVGAIVLKSRILLDDFSDFQQIAINSKSFCFDAIDILFDSILIQTEMNLLQGSIAGFYSYSPLDMVVTGDGKFSRLPDFSECIIFNIIEEERLDYSFNNFEKMESETLLHCIEIYCGLNHPDNFRMFERLPGVKDFFAGLSGSALLTSEERKAIDFDALEAIEFATMNLSMITDITSRLRLASNKISFDRDLSVFIEKRFENFDEVFSFLEIVSYDNVQSNYIANAYEDLIFSSMWRGWRGDDLMNSYRSISKNIKSTVDRIKNRSERREAHKLSRIALIFTIISMGSLIASIIALYDIQNDLFSPDERMAMIGFGIFIFGFLAGIFSINFGLIFENRRKVWDDRQAKR